MVGAIDAFCAIFCAILGVTVAIGLNGRSVGISAFIGQGSIIKTITPIPTIVP